MSAQRVTITYSGPLVFLSTDHWKQIYASLASQLPLRNLHWKSAAKSALRSIQELDVKLVPLETLRDEQTTSQVPQTVLDKPLLHLYIFICEVINTSARVYRAVPHCVISRIARRIVLLHASKSKSGIPP